MFIQPHRPSVSGSDIGYPLIYFPLADYCECVACSVCGARGNPDYMIQYLGIRDSYFCSAECGAEALAALVEYRRGHGDV